MKGVLQTSGVEELCPNCGLCCDSALFADVELRAGDHAGRLAGLGLEIVQKTGIKAAFAQPCACFDGRWCRIYADRPTRCRSFECGVLKRLQAGALDRESALKIIRQAKRQAEKVRAFLCQLGQTDERVAMTKRYAVAMSGAANLSLDRTASALRGGLMLAMDELMRQLQRDFRA